MKKEKFTEKENLNDMKLYIQIGSFIAKKLINTKITSNQISYLGFLCFILSAYFFSKTSYIMILIGLGFFQLAYIADHVDGILARSKGMGSKYGAWLDEMSGSLGFPLVFVGITLSVYSQVSQLYILLLGASVIIATSFKKISQNTYIIIFPSALGFRKKVYKKGGFLLAFRYTHRLVVPVVTIGTIFNKLYWVLLFCGIYAPFYTIVQIVILALQGRKESLKELKR